MAATPNGLVPTRHRALAPDLARGFMLALIAVANVMIYLHGRPYGLRQHVVQDGLFDRVVTAVVVTFVDARAYPLFGALFGYGLVRIAQRQTGRGFGPSQVRALLAPGPGSACRTRPGQGSLSGDGSPSDTVSPRDNSGRDDGAPDL